MYTLLNNINSSEDIKKLNSDQINILVQEIRHYIIEVVSKNGGHLASNLGVVELTVALHKAFNTPQDKIVWDVGHQSYTHKIITGRREEFKTLRKLNGLSGFPKRGESEYDVFETGHSSTSISSALGIAKARDLSGDSHSVVAVIGDGALTGGMALEALNHAGDFPTNLIVILNDNNMSISRNIGGMSNYLSRIRTVPTYFKFKSDVEDLLNKIPLVGGPILKTAEKFKKWIKYLLVPGIFFEELGFKYLGPIDGHNVQQLEDVMKRAKSIEGYPVLIHVITKKGMGYKYAEKLPEKYHGVGPFDILSGNVASKSDKRNYSGIFGDYLVKLAEKDDKVLAVTAAMPDGTGLTEFANKYKDRFFDVGIAEQHAVTFCAGLAVGGYKPIFAVYSTFLQRAYDQIVHDVCMQNLPVIFAIDRAGLVGSDGETHHGVFDISFLRHIPNISIMSPKNGKDLEEMLELATNINSPVAIRYPRGDEGEFEIEHSHVVYGRAETLIAGKDVALVAEGKMVATAYNVSRRLKEKGIEVTVINMRFIKPMDEELLLSLTNNHEIVYTLEDNVLAGGMGSGIMEFYNSKDINIKVKILSYKDKFIRQGEVSELQSLEGMNSDSIYNEILEDISKK